MKLLGRPALAGIAALPVVLVPLLLASSGGAAATAAPCNYYYEWIGKVRYPLQPDPHATYTFVVPSSQAAKDGVGFLVRGQFVHSVWTSWLTYSGPDARPFSGVNFVDNPPENSLEPAEPDPGSIDPFKQGEPMLATPRNFTLLFEPEHQGKKKIAPSLDGTPTASIPSHNIKEYPGAQHGSFWALANRNYEAFSPGYNPGGTTEDTFPVVTAVDLATGEPVDCQAYNVLPDKLQKSPSEPPNELNYGHVPIRIALKNGTRFNLLGLLGGGSQLEFAPRNPRGLVQFTRPPIAPGADVATIPPGSCSGYLGARTSTRRVSLIRVPHIPNFTDNLGVTPSTRYPNPIDPSRPWQAAYVSLSMYGTSSGFYLPNEPESSSIADREFKVDATGGSTILIWPRKFSKRRERRVVAYAEAQGWAILRGGTKGRQVSANLLFRVKAAASNYNGDISKAPCFYDAHQNRHKEWKEIPVQEGSPWVIGPSNLGSAAPQGVTCRTIRELTSGRCLRRLKRHIRETGGRYFVAHRRAPPDPGRRPAVQMPSG
jgi:hypothetical protein